MTSHPDQTPLEAQMTTDIRALRADLDQWHREVRQFLRMTDTFNKTARAAVAKRAQ